MRNVNVPTFFVYGMLLCLCSPIFSENIKDTSNVCYVSQDRHDVINGCVNNLINYPYSSPEYLFEQLYIIKNSIETFTGQHYDLKSTIVSVSNQLKARTGKGIPKKQLNSMLEYVGRKDTHLDHYYACRPEACPDLEVANMGVFAVSFNYYEDGMLLDTLNNNHSTAPFTLKDVPPRVLISTILTSVGEFLSRSPKPEARKAGDILKGIGLTMLVEYVAQHCENDDCYNPQPQKNPSDIRQEPIGGYRYR